MGWNQGLFQSLMYEKYKQQQQQTDADVLRAQGFVTQSNAAANLDMVRAGLLPKQTAADIAKEQADTAGVLQQNKYIGPLAQSQMGLQRSQARQNYSAAGYQDSETGINNQNMRQPGGFFNWLDQRMRAAGPGYGL